MVRKRAAGRRFLRARALGDSIRRRRLGPAILGTQSTPRQSAARAFAAEFLAPANRLGERIGKARWIDAEAAYELAREFGVSSRVVQRRLRNHGIAEVPDSTRPQRAA